MIDRSLIFPNSILVVGGSDNIAKPGGRLLKNLIDGSFKGKLLVINPKSDEIQGIKSYRNPEDITSKIDIAVMAIPAPFCLPTVKSLLKNNITKNFIILSAGFSEESAEGKKWEMQIAKMIENAGGTLIGPNCIGVMNTNYQAVFTYPIPNLVSNGCDLISGSGATAVFITDAGTKNGLKFSSVYSVGNAAQTCVEDVLEILDESFDEKSAKIKLLYFETIKKPQLLLKHALSLAKKGCKIVAIKAGISEAGARAASSHTGAISNPNKAVENLFKKTGIISCHGREELVSVAKVLMANELLGRNMAIITNAGGPAVMLTDILTKNNFSVPQLEGENVKELSNKLHPGSSATNPIDMLATGTAEQLEFAIDACEKDFENIDAICVIFGNPGLFPMSDVYDVLDKKIKSCQKPIFVVLPSILSTKNEIQNFIDKGNVVFDDEVVLGHAISQLGKVELFSLDKNPFKVNRQNAKNIVGNKKDVFLSQNEVYDLLDLAGISRVEQQFAKNVNEALNIVRDLHFPVVIKAMNILHKTEQNAVSLNVNNEQQVKDEFERLSKIDVLQSIEISKMLKGIEIFIGIKREGNFGHLIMCGFGGIYVEVLQDIQTALVPVGLNEAKEMIKKLKIYKLIKGYRGKKGINENLIAETICKISSLVEALPSIKEIDLNPLIGYENELTVVDARIKI